MSLNFDAMFDCHEVTFQRRCRELHVLPMLDEILCKFNVAEERPGIDNDSPRDATAHLRGVHMLVLHAEGVAQNLKDLKH